MSLLNSIRCYIYISTQYQYTNSDFASAYSFRYCSLKALLQLLEDELFLELTVSLLNEGIIGLPIHDSVLVPASKQQITYDKLQNIFGRKFGEVPVIEIRQL